MAPTTEAQDQDGATYDFGRRGVFEMEESLCHINPAVKLNSGAPDAWAGVKSLSCFFVGCRQSPA